MERVELVAAADRMFVCLESDIECYTLTFIAMKWDPILLKSLFIYSPTTTALQFN